MGSMMRTMLALGLLLLGLMLPAKVAAQAEEQAPMPWQETISSQIQAFRDGDAPGALRYAGMGFQTAFRSPEAFFLTIMGSGYAPIGTSVSHSFGAFQRIDESNVAQQVRLVGPAQELYEAVYVLREEAAGWRVQGVQLVKTAAVGI